jgi:hypothetical protein
MVELILGIIEGSLELINKLVPGEASRIKNKVLRLRKEWDEEISKGVNRDDSNLDRIERELLDLGQLFLTTIKSASSQDKP